MQPPLYTGQLQLTHRWLSLTGFSAIPAYVHTTCYVCSCARMHVIWAPPMPDMCTCEYYFRPTRFLYSLYTHTCNVSPTPSYTVCVCLCVCRGSHLQGTGAESCVRLRPTWPHHTLHIQHVSVDELPNAVWYTYVGVCMCVYMYVYVHMCAYVCVCVGVCVCGCGYGGVCVCTSIYEWAWMYLCAYVWIGWHKAKYYTVTA